ncbi:hypothetical protein [Deinococcus marmoris]|uniref:Uncharacterized protein n=1 Tax=Deinococcus marmoris TaxID=249408 RepID=A0A1U7NT18_9DEIO|nr:hypothetical protein [Deinococcus marmoris]OLV16073.1 hypothetical protein BOO71_0012898 [Deinococcus marmoris]
MKSPGAVEVYLKRAVCLLPPQTRQNVRSELHANLYQTMLDARLEGLDEADAWAASLRQQGSEWGLALNLARVYTLGLVLRVFLVGLALGGAAYAVRGEIHTAPTGQEARP